MVSLDKTQRRVDWVHILKRTAQRYKNVSNQQRCQRVCRGSLSEDSVVSFFGRLCSSRSQLSILFLMLRVKLCLLSGMLKRAPCQTPLFIVNY